MDAKELRLGNFLQDRKGRLCIVKIIDNNDEGFMASAVKWLVTSLPNSPIPLTEEWLFKFGFEKGNLEYFIHENVRINFDLQFEFKGVNNLNFGTNLEYVHQLQNLYFALTGKELEVRMFRVMCIKQFDKICTKTMRPAPYINYPIVGEIYIVDRVKKDGFFIIRGFYENIGYDPSKFRPIDDSFGHQIASEIE